MTNEEKIKLIENTLEVEVTGEVKPDLLLSDLPEWDSMGKINTIVMLDDNFGVEADNAMLLSLRTVADLMALMEKR